MDKTRSASRIAFFFSTFYFKSTDTFDIWRIFFIWMISQRQHRDRINAQEWSRDKLIGFWFNFDVLLIQKRNLLCSSRHHWRPFCVNHDPECPARNSVPLLLPRKSRHSSSLLSTPVLILALLADWHCGRGPLGGSGLPEGGVPALEPEAGVAEAAALLARGRGGLAQEEQDLKGMML